MNKSENSESWKSVHSGDGQLFTEEQIFEIAGCLKSQGESLNETFFNIGFIAGLIFPIDKPKNGAEPKDVIEYHDRAIGSLAFKLLVAHLDEILGDD